MSQVNDDQLILAALAAGDESQLEEIRQLIDSFPEGVDTRMGHHWIMHALDCGSIGSIRWILGQGITLDFVEADGYGVVHSALERSGPDRYEVLELLLSHGAPVNAHGINDWTPAHMAAAKENIEALQMLIRFGADLSIRTRIDDCATPLEEAKILDKQKSIQFLEQLPIKVAD